MWTIPRQLKARNKNRNEVTNVFYVFMEIISILTIQKSPKAVKLSIRNSRNNP